MTAGLERLNALGREEAEAQLRACCGSAQWARRMAGERPFRDPEQARFAADRIWLALAREDWLEAFRSHPRIADPSASGRAAEEQAGAQHAPAPVLRALAAANRAYEERFGRIFLVCASGRSAAEMLAALRQRLANDPETEMIVAAEEQRKIMRLRLEKLLGT